MKLAEALILRGDLQKRISILEERLKRSVKVQEGDAPPEDPAALLKELDALLNDLQAYIQRINRTNAATVVDGPTLADMISRRDVIAKKKGILQQVIEAAAVRQDRYSKSEVRFKSTVNIADLQRQFDQLAKEYREVDTTIQQQNWNTDLLD